MRDLYSLLLTGENKEIEQVALTVEAIGGDPYPVREFARYGDMALDWARAVHEESLYDGYNAHVVSYCKHWHRVFYNRLEQSREASIDQINYALLVL